MTPRGRRDGTEIPDASNHPKTTGTLQNWLEQKGKGHRAMGLGLIKTTEKEGKEGEEGKEERRGGRDLVENGMSAVKKTAPK